MKPNNGAEFDECARDYDEQLNRGLSLTGESKEWFAEARVTWLGRRLRELGVQPKRVLDFGCGTGTATPFFVRLLGVEEVVGVDPSSESLGVARQQWRNLPALFLTPDDEGKGGQVELAYCNGVFHHIVPEERSAAVDLVWRMLKPGGVFAFWENNPWNPATRYIMSRVPFDRDAILLWPREARRLLQEGGFEIVRTDFTSVFPRSLSALRKLELPLSSLPLGGQYLVLCRKTAES